MKMTWTDTLDEGARLSGWLVGAGSDVSGPTSHIATGAITNPSPTLSSLLPPVLGTETSTGDLAYHSDRVAQVPAPARFRLTAICFPRCQAVLGLTSMRSLRPRATLSRE